MNKAERKEDFKKIVDAYRDLPMPDKSITKHADGVNPQMHQALANLKYRLLLTNLAELPTKVKFLPIGSERKIAILPSLTFMQEVDTSYLERYQNLQANEQDTNDDHSIDFAEESIKTMLKRDAAPVKLPSADVANAKC